MRTLLLLALLPVVPLVAPPELDPADELPPLELAAVA